MRVFSKFLIDIFVVFLFVSLLPLDVQADDGDPVINIDIDLDGVIDAINAMFAGLNDSLGALPQSVLDGFTGFLRSEAIDFLNPLLLLAKEFITRNPDPSGMFGWWQTIVTLISSFYLLLFLVVGFMFLFGSINAVKRASAKEWLKNVLFIVVAVNASFFLYTIFLDLGEGIAQYMWVSEFEQIFSPDALGGLNLFLLGAYGVSVLLAFATLFVRYLFLLIGTILFPVGIFFYLIPPLRGWGSIIFNLLGAAILMQFIDVIIFIGTELVWQEFSGFPDIVGWAPIMAFFLIAIVNSLMIVFAAAKAVLSAVQQSPTLNTVVSVVGGPVVSSAKAVVTS